jgi:hypothetical protein
MPKRQGGHIGGKHTTIIDAAAPVVDAAQTCPQVMKVVLGIINTRCGNGRGNHRIKFRDTDSGLEITVRGNTSAQTLFVTTKPEDRHEVASQLAAAFQGR